MSTYFEIAYAAESSRLCLFTGTGFSKAVSANMAPSWQGLLEDACTGFPEAVALKAALFPATAANPLPLEEAAQVIEIELRKHGRSLHEEIAALIARIVLAGNNRAVAAFIEATSLSVITTNYDKLFEQLAVNTTHQSISPGLPIPRSSAQILVYHVHGSVDSPGNMVVTSDDYFRFLNEESYFSRKLSTLLHESTVVILGYSLGDTNLKSILSSYKSFSRIHSVGGSIIFVSRDRVDQYVKDYYAHSFGIRVLDQTEVGTFFFEVNKALPAAKACAKSSREGIKMVLSGTHHYEDAYLRVQASFFEIIASINAVGLSLGATNVAALLSTIIERKTNYTAEAGAWDQYDHLATWLIYLATLLEMKNSVLQKVFLDASLRSMATMSNERRLGYSWQAYRDWSAGWSGLLPANRALLREHIRASTASVDALELVERY